MIGLDPKHICRDRKVKATHGATSLHDKQRQTRVAGFEDLKRGMSDGEVMRKYTVSRRTILRWKESLNDDT